MTDVLAKNWWMFVLRGVFAIIFGVVAWVWPGLTLIALIYLFAAYALIDGVTAIISIFSPGGRSRWFGLLLEGILGIGAAIVAIAWPGLTALSLVWVIAAWAVVSGVFRIITAIRIREEIENEWWMGLGGAASIIFGIILFVAPGQGALTLVWLIGIWAIVLGVFLIAFGFRIRDRGTLTRAGTDTTRPAGV
jgi:uncharacterized membrane protein HdeD (DUF308 family)